jgi:hypothetical protein
MFIAVSGDQRCPQIAAFWIDACYGAIILMALILSWATSKKTEQV